MEHVTAEQYVKMLEAANKMTHNTPADAATKIGLMTVCGVVAWKAIDSIMKMEKVKA